MEGIPVACTRCGAAVDAAAIRCGACGGLQVPGHPGAPARPKAAAPPPSPRSSPQPANAARPALPAAKPVGPPAHDAAPFASLAEATPVPAAAWFRPAGSSQPAAASPPSGAARHAAPRQPEATSSGTSSPKQPAVAPRAAPPQPDPATLHAHWATDGAAPAATGGLGYQPLDAGGMDPEAPVPEVGDEPASEAAPAPTAAELRARRIAELAGYGPEPSNLVRTIPYAVRVMLRKRELDVKLEGLAAVCKRADAAAEAALMRVGEALFALRDDPRTEAIAARARRVEQALRLSQDVEAAAQGDLQGAQQALAAIAPQLAQLEGEVAELRRDEATVRAKFDALSARARQADALHAQAVQAIQALQAKPPVDRARLAALASEREARNAERRYMEVQISPTETELGEARRELAARVQVLQELQAQRAAIEEAAGRTLASREASLAAAHSMQRTALVGLARAAMMADIVGLAGEAADAADDALAHAHALRDEEDVYKRARDEFDEDAYTKGLTILVGGSVLAFVVLAAMILF